jgi:hypothetical protein
MPERKNNQKKITKTAKNNLKKRRGYQKKSDLSGLENLPGEYPNILEDESDNDDLYPEDDDFFPGVTTIKITDKD